MEPAERVARMMKNVADRLGHDLTEREEAMAKALCIAVVVDSEVSRELAANPS